MIMNREKVKKLYVFRRKFLKHRKRLIILKGLLFRRIKVPKGSNIFSVGDS